MKKTPEQKKAIWSKVLQFVVDILTIGISHLIKYGKKSDKANNRLPDEESNTPT